VQTKLSDFKLDKITISSHLVLMALVIYCPNMIMAFCEKINVLDVMWRLLSAVTSGPCIPGKINTLAAQISAQEK